jgi:hypothetical protein
MTDTSGNSRDVLQEYSTPVQLLRIKPTVKRMELVEDMLESSSCVNVTRHLKCLRRLMASGQRSDSQKEMVSSGVGSASGTIYSSILTERRYNQYGAAVHKTKAQKQQERDEQRSIMFTNRQEEFFQKALMNLHFDVKQNLEELQKKNKESRDKSRS